MPYQELQKTIEQLINRFLDQTNSHQSLTLAFISILDAETFLLSTMMQSIPETEKKALIAAFCEEKSRWKPNGHSPGHLSVQQFECLLRDKIINFVDKKPTKDEVLYVASGLHTMANVILFKSHC